MSGGRLVVLDRLGRDTKAFKLAVGSASIGSDSSCDIRVMLPGIQPHHATIAVHANRTLVRAVAGETLLNGVTISVAALQHGDTLRLGGRSLRWDYDRPPPPNGAAPPCLAVPRRGAVARARRRSEPSRRALPASGRDSAPVSTSTTGKQVAIVQPQRRDTSEINVELGPPAGESEMPPTLMRKSLPSKSPTPLSSDDPTKASLWIESRKLRPSSQLLVTSATKSISSIKDSLRVSRTRTSNVSPRVSLRRSDRGAPLRHAVLKKAHSAQTRVTKIRAPLKIDHTKQAAIMLMTGHAPRPRSAGPSVFSPGPGPQRGRSPLQGTPRRASSYRSKTQDRRESAKCTPIGDIRSSRQTLRSPLASPKKSALKDPTAKKSTRKTESIKFDLSNLSSLNNLENYDQNIYSDVVFADSAKDPGNNMSDEDITLHYSDTSSTKSSSMKTVHSRSSRIIEKSLGSPMQTPTLDKSTSKAQSSCSKRSLRGSIIIQKALHNSDSRYSRRTTKSLSEQSYSTTITSRISETPSHCSTQNLEEFSIADLLSIDSNECGSSIYNSLNSNSTMSFNTPGTRITRSKNSSLLGSSTPCSKKTLSHKTDSPETTDQSVANTYRISTRTSASITTPENTENISLNSTRISKPFRSRSRINDSDVLLVDKDENEQLSPISSRRTSKNLLSPVVRKNISIAVSPDNPPNGTITPENRYSPQDIGTPILSIQNLLDQSSVSDTSKPAQISKHRRSNVTRKTIASNFVGPKRSRLSIKSRSLNLTGRRPLRTRRTSLSSLTGKDPSQAIIVTPKSAVKLVQEAVKNKHSTAKKPHSKRALIDDLDDSDFVKELFNSPVKRKLSQSMIEFSRKFFDDDPTPSRPSRNTVALTGRSPDNSLLNNTQAFTPEIFVSPLSTPGKSPNLTGLKRLFKKNTPDNDLRNVRGVKTLLRTPRARKSINNDLSNISGVKKIFDRSPRNRLSDVRVKEVFTLSPTADFRRVAGVKSLLQKSPLNDLRDIPEAKRTLRANTPRNNLSDVRGVKQPFREQYEKNNLSDVSGVEELFDDSSNPDTTFDRLLGRPRLRAYTKSYSYGRVDNNKKSIHGARSLHDSIGLITDNVEEWLENELKKRVQRPHHSISTSRSNVMRELKKLHIDGVEGITPAMASRSGDVRKRSASELYSARKLPLKKRSLASLRRPRDASLPLKKRALPHSTPLRPEARGLSMNASELARVSPIATDEPGILLAPPESPKTRTRRGRKPKAVVGNSDVIIIVKPSPKRTRRRVMESSPTLLQDKVRTRQRKMNDSKETKTNKGQSTIVVARKPPVMSPKPSPKITRGRKAQTLSNNGNSSKKIKSKRPKAQNKESPKKTRAKVLKDAVIIRKPSPQIKTRSKRKIKERTELNHSNALTNIQKDKLKRTKNETIDQNIKGSKSKKTKEPTKAPENEQIEPPKPKRQKKITAGIEAVIQVNKGGRKAKQDVQNVTESQNKRTRKIPDNKITKPNQPEPKLKASRGKKEYTVIANTGLKKTATVEPSPLNVVKTRTVDKVIRKSRRQTKDIDGKTNHNNEKDIIKPERKTRPLKKRVVESSAVETKNDGIQTRKTIAKETRSAKAKKMTPVRALLKRPSLDPIDTAVDTKKRRTRGVVVKGTL